ncbi:probable peptidyl-tRNA hydrolase 2 [Scleropages formosus]|nr:probable peptidyl-tRNA hydrolase 2 [Scleropages formosus]XP_018615744.1 probable peptidyl-tRNA hydrolase 2 [Scleropages formosus]XP_018615745.1 probable peptidyl-tRNA hydrolase 2 [Scleropages formosus]XP_018615747.1 probable peptidyl-tRNA hydrolase 2 [Scleropages formosus]
MEGTEQSDSQEVNAVYLQQLRELDIPEEAAKQALLHTRNVSAEEAAMYYFNKLENEEEGDDDLIFKMVFVVNMDLSMGVGKVATQVGHAAVGLYQVLQEKNSWREMAWKWDHTGSKKVVMQGSNTAHLLELQALAMSLSLPTYLVQDAGQTQAEPGLHTVLALMGEEELLNNVTGSLQLL